MSNWRSINRISRLTKRLHACIFQFARGVCTNEFYLLTYHVRSQKDRLCFALRARGATVKLLKIRFRLGQPGPAIHVARIFHVTDFYEGLDSRIAGQPKQLSTSISGSDARISVPKLLFRIFVRKSFVWKFAFQFFWLQKNASKFFVSKFPFQNFRSKKTETLTTKTLSTHLQQQRFYRE